MSYLVTKLVFGNGDESAGYVTRDWDQAQAYVKALAPNVRAIVHKIHVYTSLDWPRFEQAGEHTLPGLRVDVRSRMAA